MVQGVLLVVVLVRDAVPLMLNNGTQATHCFLVVVVVMVLFQTRNEDMIAVSHRLFFSSS